GLGRERHHRRDRAADREPRVRRRADRREDAAPVRDPAGRSADARPVPGVRARQGIAAMRTIVHLSDIHTGRLDPAVVAPLVAAIRGAAPDLVVISGDLTQRATTEQFLEARRFLDALDSRL